MMILKAVARVSAGTWYILNTHIDPSVINAPMINEAITPVTSDQRA
jgi:hypothetical protein